MALLRYWDGTKYAEIGAKAAEEVVISPDQPPANPDLWLDTDAVVFTSAEADALYLKTSNGTMAGPLTLAVDPAQPLEAATKQYTDLLVTASESAPPATAPRDSVAWVQIISAVPTTTTLDVQPTSVGVGETVTLTATVTADAGTVQFKKDGVALGAPVPVGGPVVTTDVPQATGTFTYTAEYSGTDVWGASVSAPVAVTVLTLTTTTLSVVPPSLLSGGTVTITATVTANAGSVQFGKDGVAFGAAVPVDASGVAVATDTLSATEAVYVYTADYQGTASFAPSSAAPAGAVVGTPPASAPVNFSARAQSDVAMTCSWIAPVYPSDATGYRLLFRADTYPTGADDPAATVLLDNSPLTTLSYTHSGLAPSTNYYYLVCCNVPGGYGQSTTDIGTTLEPVPIPGPPVGLRNLGTGSGVMSCWDYVYWKNPTNTADDPRGILDKFEGWSQPNTPPGAGGGGYYSFTQNQILTSMTEEYFQIASDLRGPTIGLSVYAFSSAGMGTPASITFTITGVECHPARSTYEGMISVPGQYADGYRLLCVKFLREPLPANEEEGWACVERRLAVDRSADPANWWSKLALSIDLLMHHTFPSFEAKDQQASLERFDSAESAKAALDELYVRIPPLVADRRVDELYLAIEEAVLAGAWTD